MKMNYFVFGTNNMPKAVNFYDDIFADSGVSKINDEGRMTLWMGDGFMFALAEPFDGKEATVGNGTMLGINLDSAGEVDRIYQRALALGAQSEGEPEVRSGRYSAYFRDLDGNKICIYE
ncbi:VOC family protein [Maricurvus nonylphenolicus]|uniref:VOC family protein n=1 Tax=Maricurvus nonylphenolicus TaxID=1008307 RepID=UPI0036F4209B